MGPLLEGDLNVGFCPVDVHEGNEKGWNLDLCFADDIRHEVCEAGVVWVAG